MAYSAPLYVASASWAGAQPYGGSGGIVSASWGGENRITPSGIAPLPHGTARILQQRFLAPNGWAHLEFGHTYALLDWQYAPIRHVVNVAWVGAEAYTLPSGYVNASWTIPGDNSILALTGWDGALAGVPAVQLLRKYVRPAGSNQAASGTPSIRNVSQGATIIGWTSTVLGSPSIWNWRKYVRPEGYASNVFGISYVQGGVKTVAPAGAQSLVFGGVLVVNTTANQAAVPLGIAASTMSSPSVSPRSLRPEGVFGTVFGFPVVQFPPQPVGWLSTAFGQAAIDYKTKHLRPGGTAVLALGFPLVRDRAQKAGHIASAVTALFGDVQVRTRNFRVAVPGLLSLEMSPWAELRNTRRLLSAVGFAQAGVGGGVSIRNKTPSIAPLGIAAQQFGRLEHTVVGWRVRELRPSGVPVPLSPLGEPSLWKTPSFMPFGFVASVVPVPMVAAGVRYIFAAGAEPLRIGGAQVDLSSRVIRVEGYGIDGVAGGEARVEHSVRYIRLASAEELSFGVAWIDRGLRALSPVGIFEPGMHRHGIAGTRYLGVVGFVATRWLTRITPENREINPKAFGAEYGWPSVQNHTRHLRPESVRTYPEEAQRYGVAKTWNLRQIVALHEDQSGGLAPLPWPQWTAVGNRNRRVGVIEFSAVRFGGHAVSNNARLVAAYGISHPALPEYQKTGAVTHRVRPLPLDGIESPLVSRWIVVRNSARPILAAGLLATAPGLANVVNLRRTYKLQGFDTAIYGYPFVAERVRTLTFEARYAIQPPRIELPAVGLRTRYLEPRSIEQSAFGNASLSIFFRRITPRWAVLDEFGDAIVRNKTPELRTRGRVTEDWGDARLRLQWRPMAPAGENMQLFGLTRIADRRQHIAVPGFNSMALGDKLSFRRIGADPVVTQFIDLRLFIVSTEGVQIELGIGLGVGLPLEQVSRPDLLKGYIFHKNDPDAPNDMMGMGQPLVTANTIRVEPGYGHLSMGEPFISLKKRRVEAKSIGQLVLDGGAGSGDDMGSWGKPALSPHTIYAVVESSAQAVRNHVKPAHPLHKIRAEVDFGSPMVSMWVGTVKPAGIGESRNIGDGWPNWGAGLPSLENKRQYIKPSGSNMLRFGWPIVPGVQHVEQDGGLDGYAFGRPNLAPPPYVGPLFIKPIGAGAPFIGSSLIEHRNRTVTVPGLSALSMGASRMPDLDYAPQTLNVGPRRPTMPNGFSAAGLGDAWVSLRVRGIEPSGYDSFLSEYDYQAFAQRMRVRNANDAWAGRRAVASHGHRSSHVGAPSVRPGTHYIRPDGNADQYRKGAF